MTEPCPRRVERDPLRRHSVESEGEFRLIWLRRASPYQEDFREDVLVGQDSVEPRSERIDRRLSRIFGTTQRVGYGERGGTRWD